jgi:hypothetical protein
MEPHSSFSVRLLFRKWPHDTAQRIHRHRAVVVVAAATAVP